MSEEAAKAASRVSMDAEGEEEMERSLEEAKIDPPKGSYENFMRFARAAGPRS